MIPGTTFPEIEERLGKAKLIIIPNRDLAVLDR